MLAHVRVDAVNILEKAGVAQHVELIVSDRLHRHATLDVGEIARACRQRRHARAGKADLRGGGELDHDVLVVLFFRLLIEVEQAVARVIQMVHTVGVVPHDAEVLCRRTQRGKTPHRLIGVGDAVGIGIHRHAPNALDRRILHIFLDDIHVGAFLGHRHTDEPCTEKFGDGKVTVIAGDGTKELDFPLHEPRLAAANAFGERTGDIVEHHIETGVPADNHRVLRHAHHGGKQTLCLRNTVKETVVAGVHTVFRQIAVLFIHAIEHTQRQSQLFRAGLAAGHIERELFRLICRILLRKYRKLRL